MKSHHRYNSKRDALQQILLASLLIILFIAGCKVSIDDRKTVEGNGKPASETRQTGPFNSIVLECDAEVILTSGSTSPIRIDAEENLLKLIKTNVRDSTLTIATTENLDHTKPFVIYVSVPVIRRLAIDGTGSFTSSNDINATFLTLSIAGSGSMTLSLKVDSLLSSIAGSGDFVLSGKSSIHIADINGSGNLKAKELQTRRTSVDIAGSGDASVQATDEIAATISGSGDIDYYGNPSKVTQNVEGNGSINQRQ